MKPKIIANYLPQYHVIPENSEWWGDNYTDWVAVRNAQPLFEGHIQPKVPMCEKYYSLDQVNDIRWQADLAKKYGIFGFGIYHYWFSSKLYLLGTPAELLLKNTDIDINFCFIWDNATWKRTWSNLRNANAMAPLMDNREISNQKEGILAELQYGDEKEWKIHFEYLVPFFKDKRYIKIDGKPIIGFFQPTNGFDTLLSMSTYWNSIASNYGLPGVVCMTRDNYNGKNFEYKFRYSPLVPLDIESYLKYKIKDLICNKRGKIREYDYDLCWQKIIKDALKADKNTILSGFIGFDDTPRRGRNGRIIMGGNPEKFEMYLRSLIEISLKQGKEYLFLTAWNGWSEGAYLEPDTFNEYAYLEAVRNCIKAYEE